MQRCLPIPVFFSFDNACDSRNIIFKMQISNCKKIEYSKGAYLWKTVEIEPARTWRLQLKKNNLRSNSTIIRRVQRKHVTFAHVFSKKASNASSFRHACIYTTLDGPKAEHHNAPMHVSARTIAFSPAKHDSSDAPSRVHEAPNHQYWRKRESGPRLSQVAGQEWYDFQTLD